MSLATKKLSRLLRMHESTLVEFDEVMSRLGGNRGVLTQIAEDNDRRVTEALTRLEQPPEASAEDVHVALMLRVGENDRAVNEFLGHPSPATTEGCNAIIKLAKKIAGEPNGFFLKREAAERLFRKNPPQNLMREIGEKSVDSLLKNFRLEELFPAIRFAEDSAWLNDVFFHPYAMLAPEDFEERPVEVLLLPERFREIGKKFAGKKLHHISHLKELGVIFVMPVTGVDHVVPPGSTLEILTLILHYLHEVPFYSRIFRRFASSSESFAENLTAALRGDVLPQAPDGQIRHGKFLIVQRYLAKDDPSDPRLFQPHVNPEATHWRLVEEKLEGFSDEHPDLGMGFWKGQGFVGEFFPLAANKEAYLAKGISEAALISFDLVDNLISHNRQSPVLAKYLYHQQEALWNEIFSAFIGRERMEALVEENLEKGHIEIMAA